jgi:NTP pyrophosphatase (non-canonical NTP hydrolase)
MAGRDAFDLEALQRKVRAFVAERDWEQFHTPKNLATALVCEAAELAEIFQWLTPEESERAMKDATTAKQVRAELADVLVYVLRMSDVLGVDLQRAVTQKLVENARKYPVSAAKGSAKKYTRLAKRGRGRKA